VDLLMQIVVTNAAGRTTSVEQLVKNMIA